MFVTSLDYRVVSVSIPINAAAVVECCGMRTQIRDVIVKDATMIRTCIEAFDTSISRDSICNEQ